MSSAWSCSRRPCPRAAPCSIWLSFNPCPKPCGWSKKRGARWGLVTHAAYARTRAEIDEAFAAARRLRVAGVNVLSSPYLYNQRAHIFQLAASAKLPAIYQWPDAAREGGLMAYGPSLTAMNRQLAGYASRILGGAKPADLPIEQPTRFELVINLKTARALGITISQSLLLRADEVIQ